jgi:hypothetical protein
MSGQLPRLGQWHWYPLTARNLGHVPEVPGVYLLADPPPTRPRVHYVGQAANIVEALTGHLPGPDEPGLARHAQLETRLFCFKTVRGGEEDRLRTQSRLRLRYDLDEAG